MKKKFSLLIFIFLILNSLMGNIFAAPTSPECYDLFDQIKTEWREKKLYNIQTDRFTDFGFEVEEKYEGNKTNTLRSKKNYLIVGQINKASLVGKVKRGDIIISVGKEDTSNISDEDAYSFFEKLGDKETVVFLRDGKKFELVLDKATRDKQDEVISTTINNISKVDIKDSTFILNMSSTVTNYFDASANYDEGTDPALMGNIILENLIYRDTENEWKDTWCNKIDFEVIEKLRIAIPGDGIVIKGITSLNENLIKSHVSIAPYSSRVGDDVKFGDYATISKTTEGTYIIQNDFKLQTFPFDKQLLKITYLAPESLETYELSNSIKETTESLDFFIKNNQINGWDIIDFDLYSEVELNQSKNFISSATIEIQIERQHGYYIYKVLIPILLILMVCWSVVWVDPKELEARLTITIVCLLSLIAYNFVIDSELPKLEYLTVMDWIILVSYFYATVPNFISIISFRLYKKNRRLSDKIELYSKRYGASSYLVSILVIILINANLNPENSSALISWMAAK